MENYILVNGIIVKMKNVDLEDNFHKNHIIKEILKITKEMEMENLFLKLYYMKDNG